MDVDTLAASQRRRSRFVLEFDTWAEFVEFVAICRGDDLGDDAKLQELTVRLRKSADTTQAAIDASQPK